MRVSLRHWVAKQHVPVSSGFENTFPRDVLEDFVTRKRYRDADTSLNHAKHAGWPAEELIRNSTRAGSHPMHLMSASDGHGRSCKMVASVVARAMVYVYGYTATAFLHAVPKF